MSLRKKIHLFFRAMFRWFSHVEAVGLENVPETSGCILAVNHLGRLDAPMVFMLLDRQDLTALVANKYKKSLFYNWLVNAVGGIWVDRDNPDPRALREATEFLKNGGVLGIAPEGTRSKTRALQAPKGGAAYLAIRAGVPIVPTAIMGTENALHELLRLRKPRMRISFGEPLVLPPLERKDRDATLQRATDEIMCRIAALLPEAYHGVYAGHPRVQELLEAG